MAFVRSGVQRSIGGSFGRVGLGAGNDGIHAISWLGYRRRRPSPNFFSWREYLLGSARRHGLHDNKMAGAGRWLISASHRGGARHASADRRRAAVFDYATTLDLVLDHLHGHERWLPDCCTHLRLRPAILRRTWPSGSLWITDNYVPGAFPGEPRFRDPAFSGHLFSAQRS